MRADIELKRDLTEWWWCVSRERTYVVAGKGPALQKHVGAAVAFEEGATMTCDILFLMGWDGFKPLRQVMLRVIRVRETSRGWHVVVAVVGCGDGMQRCCESLRCGWVGPQVVGVVPLLAGF